MKTTKLAEKKPQVAEGQDVSDAGRFLDRAAATGQGSRPSLSSLVGRSQDTLLGQVSQNESVPKPGRKPPTVLHAAERGADAVESNGRSALNPIGAGLLAGSSHERVIHGL